MSFDVLKIQAAFVGLVGIRQPFDPAFQKLDPSFETSASGLFLDAVQYYKTKYFIDTQDYPEISDADLSTLMGQIRDDSVANALNKVFTKPVYTDRNKLFSNTFDRENVITQPGDAQTFYGYEIIPGDEKNLAWEITKVTLELVGAGDITIQLYNTAKLEPLESKAVTIGGGSSLEEVELNWVIDLTEVPYKGTYVLGYFRNGTVQPIDRDYNIGDVMNNIKGLCIRRMTFQDDFLNVDAFEQEENHNGLNFDITTYDDYTDLILQNKKMFAKIVQLEWAISVMMGYVSSSRSNRDERIAKQIVVWIQGQKGKDVVRIVGINELLLGEVDRLNIEIEKMTAAYFNDDDQTLTITTET